MRQSSFICFFLLMLVCGYGQRALSDTLNLADSNYAMLQTVTVTATRTALDENLQPYHVASLRQADIALFAPRTSPEALMMMPGVFVQKTNHGGGSPFIKGLTGNQVLIMMDGIRLNNTTYRYGPNQYLNTVDIFQVDRIELAKGTGSVQYGSDALGGVLQLFTRLPVFAEKRKWGGSVQARLLSSSMEQSFRSEMQYSSKRLAFQVGLTKRAFGDLIGGDTTGRQYPSGYDETGIDGTMRIKLANKTLFTYGFQHLRQTEVPVYHKLVLENFARNHHALQERSLQYIRTESSFNHLLLHKLTFTASFQRSNEIRESAKKNSVITRRENDLVTTSGLTLVAESVKGIWSANSGVEYYADKVRSDRADYSSAGNKSLRGLYPDNASSESISIYSLHQLKFRKLVLHAGLRANQFFLQLFDSTLGNVRVTPNALVANLALSYQFNQQSSFFANIGNGYRAPNIDDLGSLGIVDFRYELPSTKLQPEHALHVEVGFRMVSKKSRFQFSAFQMELKDMIARVRVGKDSINSYPVYRKENIEQAYIIGAEAQMNFTFLKGLQIGSSITYTYGQNQTRNEPLRRIPPLFGNAFIKISSRGVDIQLVCQAAAKQDRLAQGDKEDNRIPTGGTPGWVISNLFVIKQIKNILLQAALYNIGNNDYRIHGSGINGQGRSLGLSMKFQIN